jgi:hypothetical protein
MLPIRRVIILWIVTLCLWLGWQFNTASWAQTPPPVVEPTAPAIAPSRAGVDPGDISLEKVNQFVSAYLQVVALIERREGELQGAETESESHRIERDIETEAVATIAKAGLTRQEYIQLLGLANSDPEFGERIATQLQESMS